MSAGAPALTALRSRTGLRRVLVAYWLYNLVEIAAWISIVLWAYARGGARLAGTAAVVQLVPSALLAPFLASVGDRTSRGTALVVAHGSVAIATSLTVLALTTHASVVLVIATSSTITCTVAVVRPIHYAALPQLASSADELVSANALSSGSEQFALLAGAVVAGFGVERFGPAPVLAVLAGASALGTVLCMRLRLVAPPVDDETSGLRGAVEGLVALRGDWGSLALLLALTTTFVLGGALDVLGVAFGESVLGHGASSAGLVVGAAGIGGLVGAGVATAFAWRRRLTPVIVAAGLAEGIAFAAVAGVHDLVPTMTLIAAAGVGEAVLMVCGRTLLQRATDDRVLSRVFAVQESTSLLGLAVGTALAPVLIGLLGPSRAFLPLGLGAAGLIAGSAVLVRRLDARAAYRPLEVGLLRGVPFFGVLPAYAVERLAQRARWTDVKAGDVVVRQGDPGESFFVVGDGDLSVAVDGVLLPHVLHRGTGFGEIALLHQVPRTATVTAVTDGRLLAVRDTDFLAAVTQSPEGRSIAAEVSAGHLSRDQGTRRIT